MKQTINGKLYNTETAEELETYYNGCGRSDLNYLIETLFKTKKGTYFLSGDGGALTKYAKHPQAGGARQGQGIIPLSGNDAYKWLESHNFYATIELSFVSSVVDA